MRRLLFRLKIPPPPAATIFFCMVVFKLPMQRAEVQNTTNIMTFHLLEQHGRDSDELWHWWKIFATVLVILVVNDFDRSS
mmetsp:Transcript_41024/g.98230  ORF Transcript_41024/g.98230 Transcript_41024/m.98230 type:complete len:80 (-) Transcript_41024:103-342(-)